MITTPISKIFKTEWRLCLFLAVLSFVGASLFMTGWPKGLFPKTNTPFIYEGDGFAYLWNIQRVIEGSWYFENIRSGFPFGSNHLDYPTADTGSYLVLKLLGLASHSAFAVTNLYFLLGFSVCAVATYLVARSLDVTRYFAIACAVLYAFTSFHFGRIGHLFFTWYFVAPLFFYLGFRLISGQTVFTNPQVSWFTKLVHVLAIFVLASFGIYYDLFAGIVLVLSIIIAVAFHRSWRIFSEGILTLSFVMIGLILNVLPSLIYIAQNGESREGINRYAQESELYALKITQLLLPRGDHRIDAFADFASRYNNHFPLITENISASLGAMGSIGFLLLISVVLISPIIKVHGIPKDSITKHSTKVWELQILAVLLVGLVLMGTVGGGSSIFAMTISSSFRGWNRVSIFIAFLALLALVIAFQSLYSLWLKEGKYSKITGIFIALIITWLGLYDQTVRPCHKCLEANTAAIENDSAFFQKLESSLPKQAAAYQLPYMTYSDNGLVNYMGSYDQARGHLHTIDMRWSFGGVRGRTGDWFYRKLATLPIEQQLLVAQSMGFSGLYIDKRGFLQQEYDERCLPFSKTKEERLKNNCMLFNEVEQDIGNALGSQAMQQSLLSHDKQLVFYPFPKASLLKNSGSQEPHDTNAILSTIGFKLVNGIPVQTQAKFELPIDLRKENNDFPEYVGGVTGLSGITITKGEKLGRWSDAHAAKHVTIWLSKPLPASFSLQIRAQAAGLNAGKPVKIKIGKQIKELIFSSDFETKSVDFQTNEAVHKIEIIPADPFSPARRWGGTETRMLAIQIEQMSITPK